MDLRLISDFHDIYDHCFSRRSGFPAWCRWSTTGRPRRVDHLMLRAAGFRTPRTGLVSEFERDEDIVVYSDPCAHRGEGKEWTTRRAWERRYPTENAYACEFIQSRPCHSLRLLAIGDKMVWVSYLSDDGDGWRSNVGRNVDVWVEAGRAVEDHERKGMYALQVRTRQPLVAVDFLDGMAIDLNTAPGLQGIDDLKMTSVEIANEITVMFLVLRDIHEVARQEGGDPGTLEEHALVTILKALAAQPE